MFDAPNADGTVRKAIQVLDQVSSFGCPVWFSELLTNSSFTKPNLYRFLQTLTNQGTLAFDPERQKYWMGIRLVRLVHSAWRQSSLVPITRPHIESLAEKVGKAVHLAQFDNDKVLFVDKYKVKDMFDTLAQSGKIVPSYCAGVGKAILAIMTKALQNRSLDQQSYQAYTPATLSDHTTLVTELAGIRKNGVAYYREEHEQGIISIALIILTRKGRVVGAVSIATLTNRHKISDKKKHKLYLLKCANLIGTEAESWQVPTWS